jgi:hypothetical protein
MVSSLSNIPEIEALFQETIYHLREWQPGPEILELVSNCAEAGKRFHSRRN